MAFALPVSRTRSSSLPDPHTPAAKLRRIQGAQKRLAKLGLKLRGKKDTPTPAEVKAAYEDLKSKGIPMGSLVDYFFDPSSGLRTAHWDEFFKVKGRATQLLNWWVAKEAEAVNRSGLLRSKKEFDTDEVMGFSFQTLYGKLKDTHVSISMRVLGAMSKSACQIKDGLSKFRLMNKQVIIVSAYSACMSEFSRCNNLLKRFFRHVGMSESYSNLTAKISNTRKTPGTVVRLSQFLRGLTRKLGATGLFALVYDNINFSDKIAEQVVGRSTAVESGTCSTIWPLHKASLDDMKIEDFNEAFDKAKPLELSDIVHTPEERKAFKRKVWPKKIADIVLQNWLLNPTNKDNAFVEADLVQEHMNYWIKVFYKAHGPNTTWDWLEMISPCVYALRHLANAMKKVLGTDLGTRHAPVDLTIDIKVLMHSLKDHQVYEKVSGRILDKDDKPIPASSTPSTSNATEAVSSSPFTDDDLGSSPNDDQEANTTEDTQDEPTKVLEEDDETLALSTAEDVAFDMDTQGDGGGGGC
ncbi:hypothetical protein FA13DRAFT_1794076 [Coprinellus micaceus]|uniref:DUF6589 domain-containing protein n=1 Tax=Coprinellus micaceus TaxID=71717 RepID=A0A4Y7T332_COPMI|nr:hypothetical protein FA13DRAFT_1794076 [Coprinellus micaceus]